MAKHFRHVGDLKTQLETKKVANDGILVLDKYSDRSEVTSSHQGSQPYNTAYILAYIT